MTEEDQSQIHRDLMRFKPDGLSPNAWAVRAGVSRTVWADMRRHGNPSRRTLERLLTAAGSSLAEFEALRLGPERKRMSDTQIGLAEVGRGWSQPPLPRLPLMSSQPAGQWGAPDSQITLTELRTGEVIDQLPRPHSLAGDPDAFAVTVVDNSMWPRFPTGRRVAVSPRSSVAVGDDVLVRLRRSRGRRGGHQHVLIKHLVKNGAKAIVLRQFNPDVIFQVDAADLEAVLKIPGELI